MKRLFGATLAWTLLSLGLCPVALAYPALVSIETNIEGLPEGDALYVYDDGCGEFKSAPAPGDIPRIIQESVQAAANSKYGLTGACRLGLRNGNWVLSDPADPLFQQSKNSLVYSFGHLLADSKLSMIIGPSGYHPRAPVMTTYRANGIIASANMDGGPMPWLAANEVDEYLGGSMASFTILAQPPNEWVILPNGQKVKSLSVGNVVQACYLYPADQLPKKLKCKSGSKNANVLVYAIETVTDDGSTRTTKYDFCPDPTSPANCSDVWNPVSEPARAVLRSVTDFHSNRLSAFEAKLPIWEAREQQKIAAAQAAKDKAEQEARIAAAEQAARAAAQKAAAKARQLAEKQAQVAAAERAAADFRKKLKTAKPGDLYVMAEDAKAAGRADDAREAFRAILTNHPDSPLAGQAASQLSALGGSASGGASSLNGYSGSDDGGYEMSDDELCQESSAKAEEIWSRHPDFAGISNGPGSRWTDDVRLMALKLFVHDFNNRWVNSVPACSNYRQQVEDSGRSMMQVCEDRKAFDLQSYGRREIGAAMVCAPKYSGPLSIQQELEAMLSEYRGKSSKSNTISATRNSTASAQESSLPPSVCEQKLAEYGVSIKGLSPEPKAPTIDQFRMALWFLDGNLGVLKQYCRNDQTHGPSIAGLQRSRDEAFNSCKQVSTIPDGGSCTPLDPRDAKPHDPLAGLSGFN